MRSRSIPRMASPSKMVIASAISEAPSGVLTCSGFWTNTAANRRKMKSSVVMSVVLLGVMNLDAPASGSHGSPVPALVLRAATVYATNVRGVIGMQRHFSTVLHAGPIHHTEESDSGQLMKDGSFVKIKYVRIADDGKAFSAKQIAQRDAQTNQDWTVGKIFFKEPYDRRFLSEYVFDSPQACTACPA